MSDQVIVSDFNFKWKNWSNNKELELKSKKTEADRGQDTHPFSGFNKKKIIIIIKGIHEHILI